MMPHAIWVDEITGVLISIKKDLQKLKHFEKIVFQNKFYIIFQFLSLYVFMSIQNTGQSIPLKNNSILLTLLEHESEARFSKITFTDDQIYMENS